MDAEGVVREFHRLYYAANTRTWENTYWLGIPVLKCPFDLWVYQEILNEIRPDVIVECGTYKGGGALFFASICELLGNGRIITIDPLIMAERPPHPRIEYLQGSSTSNEVFEKVKARCVSARKVLVILDSAHDKGHVLLEMSMYGPLVSVGSYMIVEDGNVNGHPVLPDYGLGPLEAIDDFLQTNKMFIIDRNREKHFISFNPSGYLKKVAVL